MRTFGWTSAVVCALIASSTASTHAGLVSLYEFDEGTGTATTNAIGTAPNGTLRQGATWGPAMIGSSALKTTAAPGEYNGAPKYSNSYQSVLVGPNAYPKSEPFGSNNNALWQGTISFWEKITTTNMNQAPSFFANLGGHDATRPAWLVTAYGCLPNYTYTQNEIVFALRPNAEATGSGMTLTSDGTSLWYDGQYHLITITYQATTGASHTGSGTIYIDGLARPTSALDNGITSAATFPAWGSGVIAADINEAINGHQPGYTPGGQMDDFAVWNNRLTATEVKVLNNLGRSSLNYGVKNAQALLDLYANGGTATVGGKTWQKVTSGLTGSLGAVGSNFVVLGSGGAGVQVVPEPGTLCLLVAGALGLLFRVGWCRYRPRHKGAR